MPIHKHVPYSGWEGADGRMVSNLPGPGLTHVTRCLVCGKVLP